MFVVFYIENIIMCEIEGSTLVYKQFVCNYFYHHSVFISVQQTAAIYLCLFSLTNISLSRTPDLISPTIPLWVLDQILQYRPSRPSDVDTYFYCFSPSILYLQNFGDIWASFVGCNLARTFQVPKTCPGFWTGNRHCCNPALSDAV